MNKNSDSPSDMAPPNVFHITSGDVAGNRLAASHLPGEIFVWRDILYDGPRRPGWPDEETIMNRAIFLEKATGGGLKRRDIGKALQEQYRKLRLIAADSRIVLWFDACLFDQAMLAHILTCLLHLNARKLELLCIDSFPGIDPFHGLGQLQPAQLASLYARRRPVTKAQLAFARNVDAALAAQDVGLLADLAHTKNAPLRWVPNAITRWLQESPSPVTGLGRLDDLILQALRAGKRHPGEIFAYVAAADTPPQFWGDATLWAKINALAERNPPLLTIGGPLDKLPQWDSNVALHDFTITPLAQS